MIAGPEFSVSIRFQSRTCWSHPSCLCILVCIWVPWFLLLLPSPAGGMRRNMPLFIICQNSPINSINLPFMNIPMIINKPWPTDYILSKVIFFLSTNWHWAPDIPVNFFLRTMISYFGGYRLCNPEKPRMGLRNVMGPILSKLSSGWQSCEWLASAQLGS